MVFIVICCDVSRRGGIKNWGRLLSYCVQDGWFGVFRALGVSRGPFFIQMGA